MNFFDFAFWQNFASILLVTIIGIVVGILVALWINWQLEVTTEDKVLVAEKQKVARLFQGVFL